MKPGTIRRPREAHAIPDHDASVRDNQESEPLLSPTAVAELLGVKPQTLAAWRCTKRYEIPFVKLGRQIRYRRADVDAFIAGLPVGVS